MNTEFLEYLRRKTASATVGSSTVRGRSTGTVEKIREFLTNVDINSFRVNSRNEYLKILDKHTFAMEKAIPVDWGASRKCLNLFLREINYNRFLCPTYNVHNIEKWLELPLDKYVAERLLKEVEGRNLPKWKGIINLTPEVNQLYQSVAQDVAERLKVSTIHLDLKYWRNIG